jgi:glycosyltransferase involved in cell wall biosynthesis
MISGGALKDEFGASGIRVSSLGMTPGMADPRAVFRLASIVRRERPAILHTHMVHSNLLGRVARLFARVPAVISTAHSINEGGRWRELAYRLTDPLADLTTIVSNAAAARYIRVGAVPARKLKILSNGVRLETFKQCVGARLNSRNALGLDDEFVWLAVGRLDTPKDYPNLLTAFSRLREQRHVLLVAGEGHLRQSLERLTAELGLSEKVRFLGIRKDVPQLMAAADAYVMSSAWEGLPMVLLEAAASGLPIVTTAVGGTDEVVHEGMSGFLATAKNSEALADAMQRMEQLPSESRLTMGAAGRDHVTKHYSLSAVVDQWEEIYHSLLQRKRSHVLYAPFTSRA